MTDGFSGATALTTMLVVTDVERSTRFYSEALGASIFRSYEGSCVLQLLGSWLLLVAPGGPTPGKPTVDMQPPADPDKVAVQLIFRVDDCRAAYEHLRSHGAEFLAEPVDRGGEIRAFFRDPDGHLFEISQVG